MPTYFVIRELCSGYYWKDFELNDFVYEYLTDAHNIPEECIECVDVSQKINKVEITLIEDKKIFQEDWYYCLLRYCS